MVSGVHGFLHCCLLRPLLAGYGIYAFLFVVLSNSNLLVFLFLQFSFAATRVWTADKPNGGGPYNDDEGAHAFGGEQTRVFVGVVPCRRGCVGGSRGRLWSGAGTVNMRLFSC